MLTKALPVTFWRNFDNLEMTEDDSDSPPPPANLVERVVSQQEKKAVDQLKKHRENIIKHLGGRNQKLKQTH